MIPDHALAYGNWQTETQTQSMNSMLDAENEAQPHDFGRDIIPGPLSQSRWSGTTITIMKVEVKDGCVLARCRHDRQLLAGSQGFHRRQSALFLI